MLQFHSAPRQSAHHVSAPDLSLRRNAFKFIHCWQEFICVALSHGAEAFQIEAVCQPSIFGEIGR